MSETDKSDKIFDPTPGRIRKAREDGNLFKSQDVTAVTLLTVGIGIIGIMFPRVFQVLEGLASKLFLASATTEVNLLSIGAIIQDVGYDAAVVMLPFMGALLTASIGIQAVQSGGMNLSLKPLEPKPEKISPIKGLEKIFSAQGMFATLKALIKIAIVGPIAYVYISDRMEEILALPALEITEILSLAGRWIFVLVMQLLVVLAGLSGIDVAFEKWKYKKDLKMSKQELKDESRESEGDPQVRVRRKQLAAEMARRPRLDHAILQADVVVTNPTHFAVMLKYDPVATPAPMVLAKGSRRRALRIKALAAEHGVPMVEDRPLARALFHTVEEQQEIPADLYPAVATILAEIFKKNKRSI